MGANATLAGRIGNATESSEPRWPAALAVLAAMTLWLLLPARIISGTHGTTTVRVVVALFTLALLVPLVVTTPHRHVSESGRRRRISIAITGIVSLANAAALVFLIHYLLLAGPATHGRELLLSAAQIWWTNVILFALWYWELDGGGPPARMREPDADRDFAFVQMTDREVAPAGWRPRFSDYFYLSFTNSSAFSPTDTMPLSRTAKQLMLVQSTISLVTLLLVAARAVNVLS
jgi:uncharacterized membrane protein